MDKPIPLTGKELIKKTKELGHLPRKKIAIECGYYTISKDGNIRVSVNRYVNALLGTKGVKQPNPPAKKGRPSNSEVSVQKNGTIMIGSAYTKKMGLQPGDKFKIKIGTKKIVLAPVEGDDGSDENYSYFA